MTFEGRTAMSGMERVAVLKEAMLSQWRSMGGMAAMFVGTIFIAIYIQPYWDRPESRAFGEAGTTKAGFILIEFVLILLFTALIIWLARKGLQWIIKWAVLFILWISLAYALIPLASYAMDTPTEPFEFRAEGGEGEYLLTDVDASTFMLANDTHLMRMQDASTLQAGGEATTVWSWSRHSAGNGTLNDSYQYSAHPIQLLTQGENIIYCDYDRWVELEAATGEVLDVHDGGCEVGFRDGDHQWSIVDRFLTKLDPFRDHQSNHGWVFVMPDGFLANQHLLAVAPGEDRVLLVAERWAGLIEVPQQQHGGEFGEVNVTVVWEMRPAAGDRFTSATWGESPYAESADGDERLLLIGSEMGEVHGLSWADGTLSVEEHVKFNEREAFDGPIRALMLADDMGDGYVDVFVVDDDRLRMFSGWSLVERLNVAAPEGDGENWTGLTIRLVDDPAWEKVGIDRGVVTTIDFNGWHSGVISTPATEPAFILEDSAGYWLAINWSHIVALIFSTALMAALTIRPEWYVVNTAGILTGAGVITIIGVSFVPTLVIIFMVATAIYDWYAVYKSKHMLDLADTMIGLKLPILLVAPQSKGYSFLDEGDGAMTGMTSDGEAAAAEARGPGAVASSASAEVQSTEKSTVAVQPPDGEPPPPRPQPANSGGDALFMGLGDVIFPGMLVISALTFLPDGDGFFGLSAPMFVALGTLLGGLVGYFTLMSYVAMGKPQAGLPLLNGGSILGYLVAGLLSVGGAALSFGITFF
jgi:presenilin-like A22 family membrane protease